MRIGNIWKALINHSAFANVLISNVSPAVYIALVLALTLHVLWGFWERDLTFGDTSSYFADAARWHEDGQVNIVWSPIYTAYYGLMLGLTENAYIATFIHRIGLIFISTGIVAWLGYISLPRVFALLLTTWWVSLPIHYDTLYEIHLFGALPLLVMSIISLKSSSNWRLPFLIGIALISTVLVRNEYILAVGVFIAWGLIAFFRSGSSLSFDFVRGAVFRFVFVLIGASIIIGFFYSSSYIQGEAINEASKPKHTLNMCQVYAFGYQQRNSDWTGSPWTECSSLMEREFGEKLPTLTSMIAANPRKVFQHFLWNLSLTRAGIEVLLFNATTSKYNPDYANVIIFPVLPTVLLAVTVLVGITGVIIIQNKISLSLANQYIYLKKMHLLLLAALIISIAVIITQRPRPSYLLGAGVLYMWTFFMMLTLFFNEKKIMNSNLMVFSLAIMSFFLVPSYKSLPLPSKNGMLGELYQVLKPHARSLCGVQGLIGIGEYASEINNYLCSPYRINQRGGQDGMYLLSTIPPEKISTTASFVHTLNQSNVGALVVDPFLGKKNPSLDNCSELRDALLQSGWIQLTYKLDTNNGCIAAYIKTKRPPAKAGGFAPGAED